MTGEGLMASEGAHCIGGGLSPRTLPPAGYRPEIGPK